MRVGLVVYGSLDVLSGGNLYDRMLVSALEEAGHDVELVSIPHRSYALDLVRNFSRALERRLTNASFDVLVQDELIHPSVFRLNIGISKQTFQSLFGLPTSSSGTGDAAGVGQDFTALDRVMPHPVYGRMYWVCVLNPSEATFATVRPLLAEAYERAVRKHAP